MTLRGNFAAPNGDYYTQVSPSDLVERCISQDVVLELASWPRER